MAGRSAAADELAELRAARSLVAEAGLLFRLQAQQRVTETYVRETQTIIQDQLQSERPSLAPEESLLVRAARAAIHARDARALNQIQQQLTRLVDQRERAD